MNEEINKVEASEIRYNEARSMEALAAARCYDSQAETYKAKSHFWDSIAHLAGEAASWIARQK